MAFILSVFAMIVAGTFFYASWQWHSDWILVNQKPDAPAIAKTDEMTEMIAAIPEKHLFGQVFSTSNQMPITNLQMRVTGIVKVDSQKYGNFSKAYISMAGQASKVYQIGDSLPYGVKVYDITSNTVILENEGHLEKLPLPREPLKFKSTPIEEHE